ncbi:MucR family transcriptional regulator [Sphingomonas oryzagri]
MNEELLQLTAEIVTAHLSHNKVGAADLPALIQATHAALEKASAPAEPEAPAPEPAVSIRASVKPDYIVCLEDGKKLKMLKRYLRTNYNMTPEEYRAKWNLPRDYPMVAPDYAETRRTLAKTIGLGRTGKDTATTIAKSAAKAVKARAGAISDTAAAAIDSVVEPVATAVKTGRKTLGIAAAKAQAVAHLGGDETALKTAPKPRKPRALEADAPAPEPEAAKPE